MDQKSPKSSVINIKELIYIYLFLYFLALPAILDYDILGMVLLNIVLPILSYAVCMFLDECNKIY